MLRLILLIVTTCTSFSHCLADPFVEILGRFETSNLDTRFRPIKVSAAAADEALIFFTGLGQTPKALETLARQISDATGYTVFIMNSPKHGAGYEALSTLTSEEFLRWGEETFRNFAGIYEKIHVAGYSMGALLAANLAHRYPVKSCMLLAPPFSLNSAISKAFERRWKKFEAWKASRPQGSSLSESDFFFLPSNGSKTADVSPLGYNRLPASSFALQRDMVENLRVNSVLDALPPTQLVVGEKDVLASTDFLSTFKLGANIEVVRLSASSHTSIIGDVLTFFAGVRDFYAKSSTSTWWCDRLAKMAI